jgi:hypothetical protein
MFALLGSLAFAVQPLAGGGLGGLAQMQEAVSRRASSSDANWTSGNADARQIAPGETLVLADLTGPGCITHIWTTVATPEPGYSRLLSLRMYWDGETHPSVEAPLGDFFGVGHGMDVPFVSLPVTVAGEGKARNCYWPMPFRKHARIEVTNEGRQTVNAFYFQVDWEQRAKVAKDEAYFHAMYRQEYPAAWGQRYLLADIEGRGHYVGTVQSVRQRLASWYGEGDDFFFLDGDTEPTLRGTGTEDYFLDAWGFRAGMSPYFGVPLWEGYEVGDRTSVYRWHILDPVRFTRSLRVEIEHTGPSVTQAGLQPVGYGERPDDMASVAFWYQEEPHKPWAPMPVGYDRFYPGGFDDLPFGPQVGDDFTKIWLRAAIAEKIGELTPVWCTDPMVQKVPVSFEVINPTRAPLVVRGETAASAAFQVAEGAFDVTLVPGATERVALELAAPAPVDIRTVATIPLDWQMTFHPEGRAPFVYTMPRQLILEAPFNCPALPAARSVDGDLSDWPSLPFVVDRPAQIVEGIQPWSGPGDSSFQFGVAHDAEFVYIAVAVVDDVFVQADNDLAWHQDGVEVRINPRPGAAGDVGRGLVEFEDYLLVAVRPGVEGQPAGVYNPGLLPAGTKTASVCTAQGHNTEIAIPVDYFAAAQGSDWSTFGLNIAVDDTEEGQLTQLWWRPDWRAPGAYAGAGTFVK